MKIGVVSDTHFECLDQGVNFFDKLFDTVFADIDLLLHAGDIIHPDLLACLTDKPVLAVRGNCDTAELPTQRIVQAGNFRIGLMHGWGGHSDLEKRVYHAFDDEEIDGLVYGHSHFPLVRRENGMLFMNPGSPTDKRQAPFHSVGMLTAGKKLTGKIVNLDAWWRQHS
jgi:putative phosphoesterase